MRVNTCSWLIFVPVIAVDLNDFSRRVTLSLVRTRTILGLDAGSVFEEGSLGALASGKALLAGAGDVINCIHVRTCSNALRHALRKDHSRLTGFGCKKLY